MENGERNLISRIEDHYFNKAETAERRGDRQTAELDLARAENAEILAEYRKLQARAGELSRNYHGSEEEYRALMSTLLKWEEIISSLPSEKQAAEELNEHNPKLINDYLATASQSADQYLQKVLAGNEDKANEGVLFEKTEIHFLPPSELEKATGPGEREKKEVKFDHIILDIVHLLREHGIFDDDLRIVKGADPKEAGMMRQVPYFKIEIPRLNRTILACEQVGESTFVIQELVTDEFIAEYTKKELLQLKNPRTVQIKRGRNLRENLHTALFTDNLPGKKVDLRVQRTPEEWAKIIQGQMTLDEYLDRTALHRRTHFTFDGMSLTSIAKHFGFTRSGMSRVLGQLQFAKRIWINVEDQDRLNRLIARETRTPDEWAALIRKQMTLDEYLAMQVLDRKKMRIDDTGIFTLGSQWGMEEKELGVGVGLLKLAKHIWTNPKDQARLEELIQKENWETRKERSPDDWISSIRKQMTLDEYLGMSTHERKLKLKFDGVGLTAVGHVLGIDNEAIARVLGQMQFAQRVWSEPEELEKIDRVIKREARTPKEWAMMARDVMTLDEFLKMGMNTRKLTFKVDGIGLLALGGILGIDQKTIQKQIGHFLVAKTVWTSPADQARLDQLIKREARTPEEWATKIKEQIRLDEYLGMTAMNRVRMIETDNIGLIGLGHIFGIDRHAIVRSAGQLEFAKRIWNTPEELEKIQKKIDSIDKNH